MPGLKTLLLATTCLLPALAGADVLRVLSSYPPSLPAPYIAMLEAQQPDATVELLSKNTIAGIDEVLRGNRRGFDIFWSSSPEAFELLQRHDAFADADVCGARGPAPVAPFALSSMGWARRSDAELFMPAEWNDLLKPLYRNRIAMARPSRSGSTHMLIEQILQVRGWQEGWAYVLALAGNLATITARSYGVAEGVLSERFDIGLTIDFLAQSKGDQLVFGYGRPIMLVPAQIGILKTGQSPQLACEFVRRVLSPEGQRTLLSPAINRVPYDPDVLAEISDRLPHEIVDAIRLSWLTYDAEVAADRYWVVNTLFDVLITEQLERRRHLWRRLEALYGRADPLQLLRIRALLTHMVVAEADAATYYLPERGLRSSTMVEVDPRERALIAQWRERVLQDLDAAEQQVAALEAFDSR